MLLLLMLLKPYNHNNYLSIKKWSYPVTVLSRVSYKGHSIQTHCLSQISLVLNVYMALGLAVLAGLICCNNWKSASAMRGTARLPKSLA